MARQSSHHAVCVNPDCNLNLLLLISGYSCCFCRCCDCRCCCCCRRRRCCCCAAAFVVVAVVDQFCRCCCLVQSRFKLSLQIPRFTVNSSAFSALGPFTWNGLPPVPRLQKPSLSSFESNLKTFLLLFPPETVARTRHVFCSMLLA